MKNTNKKSNLLALALESTKNNVTTKKSRKSICDCLFELLFEKDSQSKVDLIATISLERLENDVDGELTAELFSSEEIQAKFKAINKTVKNGFEAAVCNGKTSASFSANKKYADYKLMQEKNGNYSIIKK